MTTISLWQKLTVEISLRDRIVGGVPTNPNMISGWLAAKMPDVSEAEREVLKEATVAELPGLVEEKASGMWTTFKKDDQGIFLEDRQVKAMFKESANILRELLIKDEAKGKKGEKATKSRFTNLKSRLAERLFVDEKRLYFVRGGKKLTEADGAEERAIDVMTAQGPRTALKKFDFVEAPATISFTVSFLRDGVVDKGLIETLLEHSSKNGLGADRSQGNGTFTYKVTE